MRTPLAAFPLALLLIAGCSSSRSFHEADIIKPQVALLQLSGPVENGNMRGGSIVLEYQVLVKNNSSEAITLRQLDIRTVSEGAYSVNAGNLLFHDSIRPLSTGAVRFQTRGIARSSLAGAWEPVLVRVIAYFESPSGPFHTAFTQRIDPSSQAPVQ